MTPEQEKCTHLWAYTGVRYRDGHYQLPGSSARNRYYGQHYHCTKCGLTRIDRLKNYDSNTFQDIQFNATPATVEEFPIEHERGAK